jgi:hypothetical protein
MVMISKVVLDNPKTDRALASRLEAALPPLFEEAADWGLGLPVLEPGPALFLAGVRF